MKPELQIHFENGDEIATRSAFGLILQRLGEVLPDLVVLDGDVKNSTESDCFAERLPDRFFVHIGRNYILVLHWYWDTHLVVLGHPMFEPAPRYR
jgi:transketolase